MNADQGRLAWIDRTLDEGEMVPLVDRRTIKVQLKVPVVCRQRNGLLALDKFLPLSTVGNQVLNASRS